MTDKRGEQVENKWGWVPRLMPGVARLMRERRAELGDAFVDECWRRGVVACEAGWFFARERSIALGVPWNEPELVNFAVAQVTSTQALLVLRRREA